MCFPAGTHQDTIQTPMTDGRRGRCTCPTARIRGCIHAQQDLRLPEFLPLAANPVSMPHPPRLKSKTLPGAVIPSDGKAIKLRQSAATEARTLPPDL